MEWIKLRNRVGNSNVTSSAKFGPEVQKFYSTEKKIKITSLCTLTALHIAIQEKVLRLPIPRVPIRYSSQNNGALRRDL